MCPPLPPTASSTDAADGCPTTRKRAPDVFGGGLDLGQGAGQDPPGGIEHRVLGIRYVESDAVGERKHRVGAHDDAEGAGEPVDVIVWELAPQRFTTSAIGRLRRPSRTGAGSSVGDSARLNHCSRAALARRRYGTWSSSMWNPTLRMSTSSRADRVVTARLDRGIGLGEPWLERNRRLRRLEPQVVGGREVPVGGGDGNQCALGCIWHRRRVSLSDEFGRCLEQCGTRPGLLIASSDIRARNLLT